jgi:hypothetical protein
MKVFVRESCLFESDGSMRIGAEELLAQGASILTQEQELPHGDVLVSDLLSDIIAQHKNCFTVWFYTAQATATNLIMTKQAHPHRVICTFTSLNLSKLSFTSFTAANEHELKYAFLFNHLSMKTLQKTSVKALLELRPGVQVFPVHISHLELLEAYGVRCCLQRVEGAALEALEGIERYCHERGV